MTARCTLALVAFGLAACAPREGACVVPHLGRHACLRAASAAACAAEDASARFTRGQDCAAVGYPCLHDAWGAVLSEARDPSGACPPGTSAP
ncbi:MAG: hypothetical protein U0234_00100 [Sandaracinus sp.]